MKRLVECGLNIDVCEGRFEQSPTHLAAFAGHAEVLHWLLQNGAFSQKLVSILGNLFFDSSKNLTYLLTGSTTKTMPEVKRL